MSNNIKKELLAKLDTMEGLVKELVVDERIHVLRLDELLLATKDLIDTLGFDLEDGYGEEYESVGCMIDYTIASSHVDQFNMEFDQCNVSSLLETISRLRDMVNDEEDDDEIIDVLCGWLCEVAAVAVEHGGDTLDIAERFEIFTSGEEFDDDWDNGLDDDDINGNDWERV